MKANDEQTMGLARRLFFPVGSAHTAQQRAGKGERVRWGYFRVRAAEEGRERVRERERVEKRVGCAVCRLKSATRDICFSLLFFFVSYSFCVIDAAVVSDIFDV